MTTKTYSVAGTSTLNGTTKIRFANDFVSRFKILAKNGHDNIELIELGGEFTKAEVCQILMNHPKMQDEDRQGAIYEYVVRNCREIKQEIEEKMLALEEQHTSGGRCVDPAQIERAVGLQSILIQARMVEQVDTTDLKSVAMKSVPVRVRVRAPLWRLPVAQLDRARDF